MTKKNTATFCSIVALACACGSGYAQDEPPRRSGDGSGGGWHTGVAAKIGTLGLGGELTLPLSETLHLRGGVNVMNITYSGVETDVQYDLDIQYTSIPVMLDWHPGGGAFRISGGVVYNNDDLRADAQLSGTETIGGNTYPAEALGTLTGVLDLPDLSPYVGIGFGNAVGKDGRFFFALDLGVMIQDFEVSLSSDSPLNDVPQFQQDLAQEEKDLEDEINQYPIYPVLMFGVGVRF